MHQKVQKDACCYPEGGKNASSENCHLITPLKDKRLYKHDILNNTGMLILSFDFSLILFANGTFFPTPHFDLVVVFFFRLGLQSHLRLENGTGLEIKFLQFPRDSL